MSKGDYPDYPPARPRKHRITVGDATYIVTSYIYGDKRWIRGVVHVRRHRSGVSANVAIYPNGGRKPSATLASLWTHLGVDPGARWKECAADHPAFPAKRSIRTAMDAVDDARKNAAAAALLAATGWTWVDDSAGHWEAPPVQAAALTSDVREWLQYAIDHMRDDSEPEDATCANVLEAFLAQQSAHAADLDTLKAVSDEYNEWILFHDAGNGSFDDFLKGRALISSEAVGNG